MRSFFARFFIGFSAGIVTIALIALLFLLILNGRLVFFDASG